MTCIAWDGKTLATDRGISRAEGSYPYTKVFVADGPCGKLMMAFCGQIALSERMLDYFNGVLPEFPDVTKYGCDHGDVLGLAINDDAQCHYVFGNGQLSHPIECGWAADGSGAIFLSGVLATGADAVKAIELAIEYTHAAAHGVDSLDFNKVFNL